MANLGLVWDEVGKRIYETGTSKCALFVQKADGTYEAGVAWNGITSIKQSPDGAEETPIYADNIKYLSMLSAENFKGNIEAFTYPKEFMECDGSAELVALSGVYAGQQTRKAFSLAYTTIVGNDVLDNDYGEKIHIVYNAKVSPSERAYETINETPTAMKFSWGFTTVPVSVEGIATLKRPTAYLVIDSTKVTAPKFTALKKLIYGDVTASKLPTIQEIVTLLGTP